MIIKTQGGKSKWSEIKGHQEKNFWARCCKRKSGASCGLAIFTDILTRTVITPRFDKQNLFHDCLPRQALDQSNFPAVHESELTSSYGIGGRPQKANE